MTALATIHQTEVRRPAPPRLSPEDRQVLGVLRMVAVRCRAAARLDLFRACAMLGADRAAATDVAVDALLRTLGQALGRSPRFFRPGADDVSFDERWLTALIRALRDGDEPSATFLLHSRVPHHTRRSVAFLCARVASGTSSLTGDPAGSNMPETASRERSAE